MKSTHLAKILLAHQWTRIRRSPEFHRNTIVNVIFGFLIFILILDIVFVGMFLHRILREDVAPGKDPTSMLNGIFIFYFGVDFVLRLFLQKFPSVISKPYLILPVPRSDIVHLLLLKSTWSLFNFFPLLIIVPFTLNEVVQTYPIPSAIAWFLSFIILMIWNSHCSYYFRIRFFKNPIQISIAAVFILFFMTLQYFGYLSLASFSSSLWQQILIYPSLIVVPMILLAGIYFINHRFLTKSLYLENIRTAGSEKIGKERFVFLKSYGEIGHLIALDLKLMIRNKRTRITIWMPFLFLFYGLFFYPNGRYLEESIFIEFMQIFIGTFITGFFIMSYGLAIFSYHSIFFGFILTNKINMINFLKSKYYLMLFLSIPLYLLTFFYIYWSPKIIIVNGIVFLFNIGFTSFFFLFLSTYNKMKFSLSADVFSMQGKGSNQFVAIFVLMLIVMIIFVPLRFIWNKEIAYTIMAMIGIAGFIFHNQILNLLLSQFNKRRYVMSEGFRSM